jgi:tRNA(fMet)-specific endonuclease VapC
VRRFFKIIRVLPWEADAADFFADIRHRLVTTGQPIGEMDMTIAARSLAVGAALVTNNVERYERIPGLVLINWN